ncbi:MAG: hypothetical protein BGO90_03145 [Legionella sp. 40-6]|nr:hypothetical protein [Legionella sp.]OJY47197.1 MAG: hypothetical protein BGO90_03145 [Legionella sp. 40-6]
MNTDFQKEKDELKDKAKDKYEQVKKDATDALHNGEQTVGSMKDAAKNTAAEYYDEGKKWLGALEQSMSSATDELVDVIKKRPLTSALVAGVVGWTLSMLMRDK